MIRTAILLATMLIATTLLGCESDQETICDKFDECNALSGVSVDDCVEAVEKVATDTQAEDCAECLDDKSCASADQGACAAECSWVQ